MLAASLKRASSMRVWKRSSSATISSTRSRELRPSSSSVVAPLIVASAAEAGDQRLHAVVGGARRAAVPPTPPTREWRVASVFACPRCAAAIRRATPTRPGCAGGLAAGCWRPGPRCARPCRDRATSTACTRSSAPCATPTTADSRTPGSSSSTRSTSSGKTLSPSGVTIISFFRPLMKMRPCSSRSPMSPVCSHPSASIGSSGFGSRAAGRSGVRAVVVPAGDVLAANENLSVVGDPQLDAGDRGADGSLAHPERVVERDDGRRLGQSIALHHREPHAAPELFEIGRQRGGAHDERPEFHAKGLVHAPVSPPAARDRDARRRRLCRFRERAHHVLPQHVEDLRDAHEHRHAARLDQADDIVRVEAAREDHDAAHHRRHVGRHRLPEQVAEGQEVDEAQWMKRLAIASGSDRSRARPERCSPGCSGAG